MSTLPARRRAGFGARAWWPLLVALGLAGCLPEAAGPERASPTAAAAAPAPGKAREYPQTEFFTDRGRVFQPLLADPREAQVKLGFMHSGDGRSFYELDFGGDVGLLHADLAADERLSLTVRGLSTARFEFFSQSFNLLNADYFGGLALGYRGGERSGELLLYHESSHLGDETMQEGDRRRIDFSREALRLLGGWERAPLRLYAGPSVILRSDPEAFAGDLVLQAGAEYRQPIRGVPCYAAVDLQSREENDWAVNVAVQVGLELGNPKSVSRRQRLFLEYYNGHSNMGQFHEQHEAYVMLGIGFNF